MADNFNPYTVAKKPDQHKSQLQTLYKLQVITDPRRRGAAVYRQGNIDTVGRFLPFHRLNNELKGDILFQLYRYKFIAVYSRHIAAGSFSHNLIAQGFQVFLDGRVNIGFAEFSYICHTTEVSIHYSFTTVTGKLQFQVTPVYIW